MSSPADSVLQPGKLPAQLLARLLEKNQISDQRVLIGPRVGTDSAAIRFGDQALVLKSDPITFPTPDIGRYLVNVNANDIACAGATPRWLMVTSLFPEHGTTSALVESTFDGLLAACQDLNVQLIGGHTEISIGIDRPILIGSMLGEVPIADLINPEAAQAGDAVILCNGIAIEGTSILAHEAPPACLQAIEPKLLDRAQHLMHDPGISVLPAANALRERSIKPRALHDPTEGGLATALDELAVATGLGIQVERDAIPILAETQAVCDALAIDPLGLIASGALLAVIAPDQLADALEALDEAGVPAAEIGHLTEDRTTRSLVTPDGDQRLPLFAVDEIARYFSNLD